MLNTIWIEWSFHNRYTEKLIRTTKNNRNGIDFIMIEMVHLNILKIYIEHSHFDRVRWEICFFFSSSIPHAKIGINSNIHELSYMRAHTWSRISMCWWTLFPWLSFSSSFQVKKKNRSEQKIDNVFECLCTWKGLCFWGALAVYTGTSENGVHIKCKLNTPNNTTRQHTHSQWKKIQERVKNDDCQVRGMLGERHTHQRLYKNIPDKSGILMFHASFFCESSFVVVVQFLCISS